MITFKQHIEISSVLSKEDSIDKYIQGLPLAKRISMIRSIEEVYPLKNMDRRDLSDFNTFNFSVRVEDLVLGQFIMLEQIITGKTTFKTEAENDLAIANLLLRPIHHKEFDNSNQEEEERNKENILNSDVRDVYGVLTKFLKNREHTLFKQFSGVFYEIDDDEEDEEDDYVESKTSEQLFQQQWYWYSMVRMLAKEDITKYDEIYMLKMSTVMPEMSYLAQKSKIESASRRQAAAMRKL